MTARATRLPSVGRTSPKVVECRLDMVDHTQITIKAEATVFNTKGDRIEVPQVPYWLARGWVELDTEWESFAEPEPWQDYDEVSIEARYPARMRIYLHAVVTASLVYESP